MPAVLNVIRENLRYTKWILWLVALSFVAFFGTAWWESCGIAPAGGSWAAVVNGQEIPAGLWQQHARQMEDQYRRLYGAQYDLVRERLDPRGTAVERLIQRELIVQDARRLGLEVSDEEVSRTVTQMPEFQENGRYIGGERLRQLLARGAYPPYRTEVDFIRAIREELLSFKWQALLTASVTVAPEEIRGAFTRRHESASFDYIALGLADYEADVSDPDDSTLAAWYDAHRDDFIAGEARRAVYVLFDDAAVADRITVTDDEIRSYYEANSTQFERSERRGARHILLSVDPEADAETVEAARTQAEELTRRAREGEDFGLLAQEFTDDEQSRASGGDLGLFGRGRMVPEFEESVFGMEPGQIDGPVRTAYGFHVIELGEIEPGGMQSLEEVREQIRAQLRFPRLRDAARDLAREFRNGLEGGKTLAAHAGQTGLEVRETGLVTRSSSIPGLGPAPEMIDAIFELEQGQVSDVLSLPAATVVLSVQEVVDRYVPPLASNRATALTEFRRSRAEAAAVADLERSLASAGGDLTAAAGSLEAELQTTDTPFRRGDALPGLGADRAVEKAVFGAVSGELVAPVRAEGAVVAMRIVDKTEPDFDRLDAERAELEAGVRGPRANRLISERIETLRNEAEIAINRALISASG